ncbi:universal stress protein [Kitasatospora cheerisanensis]|uniref:Stress-inducible protein n=1 Tax=Kitasatospora cheerisanensis KCTC 2395 TaxID=1348663 RepID=A0A066ZA16_9ACTN|nr:universal stress protein [Kitasatospora cheerisanensis]KDN87005.1 stress-inducible protein [Kitasatospora cheerisanensis KCTC 2395]
MNGTGSTAERRIVTGVDGSDSSRAALRWAVRQAALTGATVEAVITWEYPAVYGWGLTLTDADFTAAAEQTLAKLVEEENDPAHPVTISRRVQCGNAARVLLDAAEGAELLVIGSRGHGGFTGALLGSVGQHCVQHAPCPVVVVRDTEHRG